MRVQEVMTQLEMRELMHPALVSCAPDDDVRQALTKMAIQKIHRLPVIDQSGALKGILSIDDLVARTDGTLKDDAMRALETICGQGKPEPLIIEATA